MSRGPEASAEAVRRKKRPVRRDKDHQPAWLWLVLLFVLTALTAAWASSCGRQQAAYADVPLTEEHRTRLETASLRDTSYFTDRSGWLEANRKQAEKGLRYFYEKTGVQPHVYVRSVMGDRTADRAEMDSYARSLYGSLFGDEAHLLILVDEQPDREEPFLVGFAAGRLAASVMDEEALSILEAYWKIGFAAGEGLTAPQKAAAAGDALRRTADNIMGVHNSSGWVIALIVLLVLLLLLAARDFLRNWNRLKKKEEKAADGNA
ncbi:MAG: hypothetical protein J5493_08045 [Lachnospiraceae bacterium]|nr:hypothetical protein [Lachnospiraceae bacterium]